MMSVKRNHSTHNNINRCYFPIHLKSKMMHSKILKRSTAPNKSKIEHIEVT